MTIADSTPGSAIYYTTNGTTPTTGSTLYAASIAVGATETIKAMAAATASTQSAVATATYTISVGGSGNSYSTVFPLTENPISEGGMWLNGGANGLKWSNCATSGGFAYGTQPGTGNYDDSVCALTGTWGANQSAQVPIKVNSTSNAQYDEVEIHLNTTITASNITGYEISCSVVSSNPYLQIVRWNGALGKFTSLNSKGVGCKNGDVLSAARSGNTITAYINGTAEFSVTDSTYTGGAPGMGFYIATLNGTAAAADAGFGATAFSAKTSGSEQ